MFSDVQDWLLITLHITVVGLHATEISTLWVINTGVIISAAYLLMSAIEVYQIKKHLKESHAKRHRG